jgi:hypothetical protein
MIWLQSYKDFVAGKNTIQSGFLLGNLQSYKNRGAGKKQYPGVCRFCSWSKSCSFVENGRFFPNGYRKKRLVAYFVANFVASNNDLETMRCETKSDLATKATRKSRQKKVATLSFHFFLVTFSCSFVVL